MSIYEQSSPKAINEIPSWAWATTLGMILCAMAMGTAMCWTIAWQLDRQAIEEHRALLTAQALAQVAAKDDGRSAQKFINVLADKGDESLIEAFVIGPGKLDSFGVMRDQAYIAALDAELRSKPLAPMATADPSKLPQAPRHKLRIDRAARVTAGLNIDNKPGRAAAWIALGQDPGDHKPWRAAQVPVRAQQLGSAGVTYRETSPVNPTPWWILLITTLLVGGAAAATFVGAGDKLKDVNARTGAFIGFTLLGAVALLGAGAATYLQALEPLLAQRLQDARLILDAAQQVGLDAASAQAILQSADIDFSGATGLLLGDKGAALLANTGAAAVIASARAVVAWVLLALCLFGLGVIAVITHRPLLRAVVAGRENPYAYLYVLPSMVGMGVLVFVPFTVGVGLSLFAYDAPRYHYVGLANFAEILMGSDAGEVRFYWTLFATILWTVCNVILHASIGLGLALLLKDPALKFRSVYRVLLIIPWAIPNYITALIWKGMFNTEFGAINRLIETVQVALGVTPNAPDWLGGSFATAFMANLVTNTWLGFPFMMVVALGALQSIPGALYEAAEVDGASKWQQFRHITLPLLKPALFPAIILGSIWTFNMFNVIYLVSGGGPENSTEILITDAYRAFAELNRYGLAAAYSVIIFVILFLYTTMTNRITKATEGAFE